MAKEDAFTVVPNFTLFRVDPEKVVALYNEGRYVDHRIRGMSSTISGIRRVFNPTFTSDKNEGVFSFRDKSGSETVIATTNAIKHRAERETKQPPKGGRCHYCRLEFTHESVGVVLGKTDYHYEGQLRTVMFTDGTFDDFRCALAYIEDLPDHARRFHPNMLTDTTMLYSLMHPKGPILQKANDWRLLKENGGSLDQDIWKDEQYRFVELADVMVEQARVPFMRFSSKA